MNPEEIRKSRTVQDLLDLNVKTYCELGPGHGEISCQLKAKGKEAVAVEGPWLQDREPAWVKENGVRMYYGEFFTTDLGMIEEEVDCFILAHAIAHFRRPPHLLLKKVWDKLPSGGYFYLSTVNGCSYDNVMKLFRGQPVTGTVNKVHKGKKDDPLDYAGNTHQIWDDWTHVKEYTMAELETIFKEEQFQINKIFYRNNFSHWKRNLVTKMYPRLSEEVIVVAQKP